MKSESLSGKRQNFRIQIRDKQRKHKFNNLRSQFIAQITITTEEIQKLKKLVTQKTIPKYLQQLKYISMNPPHLQNFLQLAPSFINLANTTKDQYLFISCIHILINMCSCKNYTNQTFDVTQLIKYLGDSKKQNDLFWLFGNMLQLKNQNLCQLLSKNNILNFIKVKIRNKLDFSQNIISFSLFIFGLLINSKIFSSDDMLKLIQQILNLLKYQNQQVLFDFCNVISLVSFQNTNTTHYKFIAKSFRSIFSDIIFQKKSVLIIRILYFLQNLSIHPNAFQIFLQLDYFKLFNTAFENRHPQIRPLVIYILSNMTINPSIKSLDIYMKAFGKLKQFQSQAQNMKLSLVELISSTLINSDDNSWLNMFLTFGLIDFIKYLLNSSDSQIIFRGIYLLEIILEKNEGLKKACEQKNIHQILHSLQSHMLDQIYQKCFKIIDKYFKIEC